MRWGQISFYLFGLFAGILPFLTACQNELFDTPPRLATQTAIAQQTAEAPGTPVPATSNPSPDTLPQTTLITPNQEAENRLRLWVNATTDAEIAGIAQISAEFEASHDIYIETIYINPDLLPNLLETAVLSGTLPDLILHPIDYSVGWYQRGIFSADSATAVLQALGTETFDASALTLLTAPNDATQIVALPSDGWKQLLIYRTDWFEEKGLALPDDFGAILEGAEAISDTVNLITGLVVPTESNLHSTQYLFEQWGAGNGCQLIDEKGEVLLLQERCAEAFRFYQEIINGYSPSGVQTDTSVLNAYLEGHTGMIVASPAVLPVLAGLDAGNLPRCPKCGDGYLIENSGFVPAIHGFNRRAPLGTFSQINALGIVAGANPQAEVFAQFWFEAGYIPWLSVESERKVPLRHSSTTQPNYFLEAWQGLPIAGTTQTLDELYNQPMSNLLADQIAQTNRWGFQQGQGELITQLAQEKTFSLLLQELLSGYFNVEQTVLKSHERVIDLIPNYQYHIEPQLTPTLE